MSQRKRYGRVTLLVVALITVWHLFQRNLPTDIASTSSSQFPSTEGESRLVGSDPGGRGVFLTGPDGKETAKQRACKRYMAAAALESRTLPPDAQGKYSVQKLITREGSYPLLRVEQDFAAGQPDHPTDWRAMVADHLMVKARDGVSEEDLTVWATGLGFQIRKRLGTSPFYLLALPNGNLSEFDNALVQLNQQNLPIEYAEPDPLRYATSVPNDPKFAMQWALHNTAQTGGANDADVDAPEAWDVTRGSSSIVVAVLDSGMDLTHPDLVDNLWVNPGEIPNNGIDDDNNGRIDDVNGWNFHDGTNYLTDIDPNGHGTHCAGILGASGNNALGVSGIAPLVKIMPLRVMDYYGVITGSHSIDALLYATARHVLLTSNSYGGTTFTATEKAAIDAANAAGVLCICAAGNDFPSVNIDAAPQYPGAYSSANIINVTASIDTDALAAFGDYGATTVDLAAPGVGILSTVPGNNYAYESGSSMSTPLVAGACVLVKAAFPTLTIAQVKTAILNGVDPSPAFAGKMTSGGRLNVARSVRIGNKAYIEITSAAVADGTLLGANGNGDGIINAGETFSIATTIRNTGPIAATSVTTNVSIITGAGVATLVRSSRAWGTVAVGTSLTNNTAGSLPFLVQIAAGTAPQSITLRFTHTDGTGSSWFSERAFTVANTQTLAGKVTLLTGGAAVSGATVSYSGAVSGTVTTAANGTYTVNLPEGSYNVSAITIGYERSTPQAITLPPAASNVNFTLGRSVLAVSPTSLSFSQAEEAVVTKPLTLTNTGNLPITISIENSSINNGIDSAYWDKELITDLRNAITAQAAVPPLPWQEGFEGATSSLTPAYFHDEYTDEFGDTYVIDFFDGIHFVVTNQSAVGGKSLYYRDPANAGFDNGMERIFRPGTKPRYIGYWVRPGATTGTSGCMSFETGTFDASRKHWSWYPLIDVCATEGGMLAANGEVAGGDSTVPFVPKTWHHIELRNINWTTRTFDYWVNNSLVKSAIPIRPAVGNEESVRLHVYNATPEGESWWDELRVLDYEDIWLSHSTSTLTIPPGGNAIVNVTASAVNQRPGTYTAQLNLRSNDPVRPLVNVPVALTVTLQPNTAPVVANQTVSMNEDTLQLVTLTATDAQNDPVRFIITALPAVGQLFLNAAATQQITSVPQTLAYGNTSVYYRPPVNARGTAMANFKFTAKDYRLTSTVGTITFNVLRFNAVPVANEDIYTNLASATGTPLDVLVNDTDQDGETLSVTTFTQGASGTVTKNAAGKLVYVRQSTFLTGQDSFTYNITDPSGGTAMGTVWIIQASPVTVNGVEDTDLVVNLSNVLANTSGVSTFVTVLPEGGTIYQSSDGITVGSVITAVPTAVANSNGCVIFRPGADGFGAPYATIGYSVQGHMGATATAAATINLSGLPDAPVAVADVITMDRSGAMNLPILQNDVEPDREPLTISIVVPPAHGTLNLTSTSSITYSPSHLLESSRETFSYTVTDTTGRSSSASVTIFINGPSRDEWPTQGGSVQRSGYSPNYLGTAPLIQRWSTPLAQTSQQVVVAGGRVIAVSDGYGAGNSIVAFDGATGAEIWRHDTGSSGVKALAHFDGKLYFRFAIEGYAAMQALNANDGQVDWTMRAPGDFSLAIDAEGIHYASYLQNRNTGAFSRWPNGVSGTRSSAIPLALMEGRLCLLEGNYFHALSSSTGGLLWFAPVSSSGGSLSDQYVACSIGFATFVTMANALVVVNLYTGQVEWTNPGPFQRTPACLGPRIYAISGGSVLGIATNSGAVEITYVALGETGLISQPIVTNDSLIVTSSSATYIFDLTSGNLRQKLPVGGIASVASGSIYLAGYDNTIRRFQAASLTNQAPVATTLPYTTDEDTALSFNLSGTDANNDILSFVVDTLPASGALFQTIDGVAKGYQILNLPAQVANREGRLIYQPATNASGSGLGNFTYRISDGATTTAASTTLNVHPVNDAPVGIDDEISLGAGESLAGFMPQLNDWDQEGSEVHLVSFTQPRHGTTSTNGGGLDYVPAAALGSGTDSFEYIVADSVGAQRSGVVRITFHPAAENNIWPTIGGSSAHAGYQAFSFGTSNLTHAWTATLGGTPYPLAVAQGKVFATLASSPVRVALDAKTGSQLWRTNASIGTNISAPTYDNGILFIETSDTSTGRLMAVSALDGSQQWASAYGRTSSAGLAPVVQANAVYAGSQSPANARSIGETNANLMAFDAITGTKNFSVPVALATRWTPSIQDGHLYSFVPGGIIDHSLSSGTALRQLSFTWGYFYQEEFNMNRTIALAGNTGCLINNTPIYGLVLFGNHELTCFDLPTNTVRWKNNDFHFYRTPALTTRAVYAIATSSPSYMVKSYDTATGNLLATYTLTGETQTPVGQPIVTNDTLIVSSPTKTYIFNLSNQALRQTLPLGGAISLAQGSLYVSSSNGTVQSYSAPRIALATNIDSDADGQSNNAESLAGTDAYDSADVFKVSGIAPQSPGSTSLRISWPGKAGRNYRVQCSSDLKIWTDISPSLSGTTATMGYDAAPPVTGKCFLRVRVE
jgi:hypothetical protein